VSDASKVVMGTLSLRSLDELAEALEMSENVIFSVAYDGTVMSPDPGVSGIGLDELLRRVSGMNVREAMLFDLGSIRNKRSVDLDAVSRMASKFQSFYVSGHITATDLKPLEDAGAAGAVIDFRTLEGISRDRT